MSIFDLGTMLALLNTQHMYLTWPDQWTQTVVPNEGKKKKRHPKALAKQHESWEMFPKLG